MNWSIAPRQCPMEYDPTEYEQREFVKGHSSYWEVRELETKYMTRFHVQKKLADNVYMVIFGGFDDGEEDKPKFYDTWFFKEKGNYATIWGVCDTNKLDTKVFGEMISCLSINLQDQMMSNLPQFLWGTYHDVRKEVGC
jgi:hypothetical protein